MAVRMEASRKIIRKTTSELTRIIGIFSDESTIFGEIASDAAAHYTLARIHYLAFSRGAAEVPALGAPAEDAMPEIPGNWLTDFDLYEARQRHALELALKDLGETGPRVPPEKTSALEEAGIGPPAQLQASAEPKQGRVPRRPGYW